MKQNVPKTHQLVQVEEKKQKKAVATNLSKRRKGDHEAVIGAEKTEDIHLQLRDQILTPDLDLGRGQDLKEDMIEEDEEAEAAIINEEVIEETEMRNLVATDGAQDPLQAEADLALLLLLGLLQESRTVQQRLLITENSVAETEISQDQTQL